MKINYYKFENKFFLSRTTENIKYDMFYCVVSNSYNKIIDNIILTVDIRNVNDYELGITPSFLYLLTKKRSYMKEKSTAYKIKKAIVRVKISGPNIKFFLDKALRKFYPILRKKLIPISKNVDSSNQWVHTLDNFAQCFKNSKHQQIQDWNLPIQVCYKSSKNSVLAKYCYFLFGLI